MRSDGGGGESGEARHVTETAIVKLSIQILYRIYNGRLECSYQLVIE